MKIKNKGQTDLAIGIATAAIIILVAIMVVSNLFDTANGSISSSTTAVSAIAGRAAMGNITNITWAGITLVGIGLIVVAGFGIIGYMILGRR